MIPLTKQCIHGRLASPALMKKAPRTTCSQLTICSLFEDIDNSFVVEIFAGSGVKDPAGPEALYRLHVSGYGIRQPCYMSQGFILGTLNCPEQTVHIANTKTFLVARSFIHTPSASYARNLAP